MSIPISPGSVNKHKTLGHTAGMVGIDLTTEYLSQDGWRDERVVIPGWPVQQQGYRMCY